VLTKINQVKDIDSTVLITGESGTGKELVARAIHEASTRSEGRFEAVNCGAIPENLLESELFGHKRGAFTDAKTDRKGLFELCENGTLFLDEIGEMPPMLQVKLLRVIQEKEVMPLGSGHSVKVNARVVTATNKSLPVEIKKGTFRTDLYYRLNVLQIHLPTLRERASDIPVLVRYFLGRFNQRFSRAVEPPSNALESRLLAYRWPGNVRELQNAMERGVVLSKDNGLHLEDMLEASGLNTSHPREISTEDGIWSTSLSDAKKNFERTYLQRLLEATGGNISEIARISGRYRADIYRLMTKYGVEWTEFRAPPRSSD
jgi:DNA-binding NtrC family response regulator